MEIREFADMDKFEDIMNNWAKATQPDLLQLRSAQTANIFPDAIILRISVLSSQEGARKAAEDVRSATGRARACTTVMQASSTSELTLL